MIPQRLRSRSCIRFRIWNTAPRYGIREGMESIYPAVQKWLSDPVVIMILAFIGTSVLLSLVKYFISARKK